MTDDKSADETQAPAADADSAAADSAAADSTAADSAAADSAAADEVAADEVTDANETEVAEDDAPEEAPALDLEAQLVAANETIEALKDQALRGQAEAENVRRRASRDVENAHKYALEKFAGKLLPVLDGLEKAIEVSVVDDSTADVSAADAGVNQAGTVLIEGVELSLKLFLGVLSQAGIDQIDPLGEPFDPQYHEAIAILENPAAEPNSVLEVMQKGYALNGRLIRAAKVVVSKAPASSDGSEDESEDGSEDGSQPG